MRLLFDERRFAQLLHERSAVGLLALTPANIFHLTGCVKSAGAAAIVFGDSPRSPYLVLPNNNVDFVIEGVPESVHVVGYGRFVRAFDVETSWNENERRIADLHAKADVEGSRDSVIGSVLRDKQGTLLCDLDASRAEAIGATLEDVAIRSDPSTFKWLRMVKTPEESRRLKTVAAVTESAIEAVAEACVAGVSQDSLSRTFCASLARSGAQLRLAHISFGRSGAFGNANVPDDTLESGDFVKLDVGAVMDGYASDMSRCFSLGAPSDKARAYYNALLAGQEAALEQLEPGRRARDVFDCAVAAVRSKGIPHYDRTNVGHGIGVDGDGYDPPLLAPTDETPLEAGMVLCVETPYYEIGFGGLQVEDMVLVTDDSFEFLTLSPRDMWSLG